MEQDYYSNKQDNQYWFISTISPQSGRLVVLKGMNSREEAYQMALSKLTNSRFEVFSMPTKDLAEATRHAKYLMFHEEGDIEKAIRRAKHNV